MDNLFIPYSGDAPVSVSVNGHRVLILSDNKDWLSHELEFLGADRFERIGGDSPADTEFQLSELASQLEAHILIAPEGVEVEELISSLEAQLPWIH